MPTIILNPAPSGDSAALNVDGRDVLTMQVGVNGNVSIGLPAPDFSSPDVFFTRQPHAAVGSTNTGIDSDSTDVWADLAGKPRISLPIESGTPASPSHSITEK